MTANSKKVPVLLAPVLTAVCAWLFLTLFLPTPPLEARAELPEYQTEEYQLRPVQSTPPENNRRGKAPAVRSPQNAEFETPPGLDWSPYANGLLISFGFVLGFGLTAFSIIILNQWLRRPGESRPAPAGLPAELPAEPAVEKPAAPASPPSSEDKDTAGQSYRTGYETLLGHNFGNMRHTLKGIENRMGHIDALFQSVEAKLIESGPGDLELNKRLKQTEHILKELSQRVPETDAAFNRLQKMMVDTGAVVDRVRLEAANSGLYAQARALRGAGNRLLIEEILDEAAWKFSEALSIMVDLCDREPDNRVWQRDLVLAEHNLGRALEKMGRDDEALSHYLKALKQARALASVDPDNRDWQRGLAASYSHVGRILTAHGRLAEARENYERDLELMSELIESQPDNRTWQCALAGSCHNLAQVLEKMELEDEALDKYRQEMELVIDLIEKEPDNLIYQHDLAVIHSQVAELLKHKGQLKEALAQARAGQAEIEKLAEREPKNPAWRRELAVATHLIEGIQESMGA